MIEDVLKKHNVHSAQLEIELYREIQEWNKDVLKDERALLEATMDKVKEYEKAMQRIDKKVHSIYAVGLPKIESKLWEIKNIIDKIKSL